MIWLVLSVNFIAALIYLIRNRRGGAVSFVLFLLFLAVPILGILMYYMPIWAFRILHGKKLYEVEDLILAGEDEVYDERPDMEREMNMIPVKEALAVNDAEEKRKFILNIIKEDLDTNYKTILPALKDSDSETSHYAAAAVMEIQRRRRKKVEDEETLVKEEGKSKKELLEALEDYIESDILTSKDLAVSKERYITYMEEIDENELADSNYYLKQISYLMDLKRYKEAEDIAKRRIDKEPTEKIFEKLLELYYLTGRRDDFDQTMKEIKKAGIVLSPRGLERLRFWLDKEGKR